MSPLITVIVRHDQQIRSLQAAMLNLRQQSYQKIEILLVDETPTKLQSSQLLGGCRTEWLKKDGLAIQGLFADMNIAAIQARGDWITILDAEDMYAPERLERLLDYASSGEYGLVLSGTELCGTRGLSQMNDSFFYLNRHAVITAETGAVEQALLTGNLVLTTSNLFIHKRTLEAVGPFRPYRRFCGWDYSLRAIGRVRMGWLKDKLLKASFERTANSHSHWQELTELGLTIDTLFFDFSAPPAPQIQTSDVVFRWHPLLPAISCWLSSERRRLGLPVILEQLATGVLSERIRAAFESPQY